MHREFFGVSLSNAYDMIAVDSGFVAKELVGSSAPEIVEALIQQAERLRASDVHLQMRGTAAEVSFRLDGVLTPGPALSADIADRVFGRIKFLARLKTYEDLLPQEGRIEQK